MAQSDEQLQAVLQAFLQPNNEARVEAEKMLVKSLKQKSCVEALMKQLSMSADPGVRHLASIVLRKKIANHWKKLAAVEQQAVCELLLKRLAEEPEKLVRIAVAHLISVVGKLTIPKGKWNELFPFLLGACKSEHSQHREMGMVLLYALTDTVEEQMRKHLDTLVGVFNSGLGDSEVAVRVATLRALVPVIQFADSDQELRTCLKLLAPVMTVLQECIELHAKTEDQQYLDITLLVFEFLDDLVQVKLDGLSDLIPQLMGTMLGIASNSQVNDVIRELAAMLVGRMVTERPKTVIKHNLLEPVIQMILGILTENYDHDIFDNDQYDDDDENNASTMQFALQLLDEVSFSLPNKKVYPPCMQWCKHQILSGSGTPATMKAAVLVLGLISKGCREPMRKEVDSVLEMLVLLLRRPESQLRQASCVASSQILDYLQPEVLEKVSVFVPVLLNCLTDPEMKVREKCAYTIEAIATTLEKDVEPFLPQLMENMMNLLKSGEQKCQEICISSICALVEAVGKAFEPYVPKTLSFMKQVMSSEADEHLSLRAKATECVGVVATCLGKEVFHRYFPDFFPLIMAGLQLGYTELEEHTFGCFQNMAEVYQEEWGQQLAGIMPFIAEALAADDTEVKGGQSVFGNTNIELNEDDEDSDADSDATFVDSDLGDERLRVRAGDLDKKSAAIRTVGVFAKCTKAHFKPYLEEAFEEISNLLEYFHEDVRENCVFALRHLCSVAYIIGTPGHTWQPGIPQSDTFAPPTREAINMVMTLWLQGIEEEDSKEVVKTICDSVADMAKEMGPSAIHVHIEQIIELTLKLMNRKTMCQEIADDDDGDDDEDHDSILMDAVFEMIEEICKAYGGGFAAMWGRLLDGVLGYLTPKRPEADHVMALASLAVITKAMGADIAPFFDRMFPPMVAGLQSGNPTVRSNSCFGIGEMCRALPAQTKAQYDQLLSGIQPSMTAGSNPGDTIDNACSALCKMIQANFEASHFNEVFPVLLDTLPLQKDFQENATVYEFLCYLLVTIPDKIAAFMPKVLTLLAQSLVIKSTEDQSDVREGVASTLRRAAQADPNVKQFLSSQLPAEPALQAAMGQVLA